MNFIDYVLKPIISTFTMIIFSISIYKYVGKFVSGNVALIIAIFIAVIIYVFMIFKLRILKREDIKILNFK